MIRLLQILAGLIGLAIAALVIWVVVLVLAIVALVWIFSQRRRRAQTGAPPTLKRVLALQKRAISGRVPGEVSARVAGLHNTIMALWPRVERLPAGSPERYLVQATATDYLPAALDAYLGLPRGYARQPLPGGPTPTAALLEQLDVLDRQLREVAQGLADDDAQRLLANGRFLREKFEDSELEPKTPSRPAPAR